MNQAITEKNIKRLQLVPSGKGKVGRIFKSRVLIGRSRCCDIVINHPDVSAIHAVLEVKHGSITIYDMNSSNGTFVSNQKIVRSELTMGQEIFFGKNGYTIEEVQPEDVPAVPLKILEEALPPTIEEEEEEPKQLPATLAPSANIEEWDVCYPLVKDPKADYSEYIFEDADEVFPIFRYEVTKRSVEVIILFRDEIFSIDYLPLKDRTYRIRGKNAGLEEIELSTMKENEVNDFVKIAKGDVFLEKPEGFSTFSIKHKGAIQTTGSIVLEDDDIVCFRRGPLQIFVRGTDAPPAVRTPAVLRMDRDFKKYLVLMLLLVISFLAAMTMFEVDKEIEKEKIPERIATILYKKKLSVKKPKPKVQPEKILKKKEVKPLTPQKKRTPEKKEIVTKAPKKKTVVKKVTKSGDKQQKKVGVVKKAKAKVKAPPKKVIVKKVVKPKKTSGRQKSIRRVKAVKKKPGIVDTYVSTDFKNTLNSFLSKGKKLPNAKVANDLRSDSGELLLDTSVASSSLKQTKVKQNIGSLTGATSGTLDSAKGFEGIESKKRAVFMDVPVATVTLSSMDPSVVRSILMDYLPQFKYCYQKVLEKSTKSFDGSITLEFVIGASGHVADAGLADSSSKIPARVKGCIIDVLRGIKFPEPLGGGKVGVTQPMNFRVNN